MALLQALKDDFAGTSLSPQWTVVNGTASVSGGRLALPCTAAYTTVQSVDAYDLTASHVFAKIIPDQGGAGYEAALYVGDVTGANGYIFGYEGGNLEAAVDVGYAYTPIGTTPYDAAAHAWVRVRESGGTLYYDASPDGLAWANLWTSDESNITVGGVYAQVYSGYSASGTDGTSYVESFGIAPASSSIVPLTGSLLCRSGTTR